MNNNFDLYEEREEKEEKIDFIEIGVKFLNKWPWFVASVGICLIVALAYLYFIPAKYEVSSSIVVKDDKKGGSISMDMAVFETMGLSGSGGNVDNEVIILSSLTNVQTAIKDLSLHTTHYEKSGLRYHEVYPHSNSPLQAKLVDVPIEELAGTILLDVEILGNGKIRVEYKTEVERVKDAGKSEFDQFPIYFTTLAGTVEIGRNQLVKIEEPNSKFKIKIAPLRSTARAYKSILNVVPASKTTSIISLSFTSTNIVRGTAFLNHLVEVYNRNTNIDKNEEAQKTVDFLTERLQFINEDLSRVESDLEKFKKGSSLTNISLDAQMITQQYSLYEQKRVENATQLSLVQYLKEYIDNPENRDELIPANIGVADVSLNSLVSKYNEMLLEKKRLERASTGNNPALINIKNALSATLGSIQAAVNNMERSLLIGRDNLTAEAERYSRRIMAAPTQEKTLVSIAREQETLAVISQFLLQKREENAIALAVAVDNARFVDRAMAEPFPVSPKKKIVLLMALFAGLLIPAGIVLLKDWLQFKISAPTDIAKLTSVPLLGTISKIKEAEERNTVCVKQNENNRITEEFRGIRANLKFLATGEHQVILLTSSVSGEGKSFISANLAVSLSLLKKKVLLIGLDLRRPALLQLFNLSSNVGISLHLADPDGYRLNDLILSIEGNPYLSVINAGPIPPNASELLASPVLGDAIEKLKQQYDYVILDTAPVGLVADTLSIANHADISIYVSRADYTNKKDFIYVEELYQKKMLPGLSTVLNVYDVEKNRYSTKYGYGAKNYGYE